MSVNTEQVIERLRELEAQAEVFRDQCHKTRMLLEAEVSTSTKKSKVDPVTVANVIAERRKFLNKKTRQLNATGNS